MTKNNAMQKWERNLAGFNQENSMGQKTQRNYFKNKSFW